MKVLIIGGGGFIGSHVADELHKKGYEINIFDLKPSQYLKNGYKMIVGNVTDKVQIQSAIQGMDYVYNFASIADIKEADDNPILTAEVNFMSTLYMLDACVKYNVKRFLFASTIYVYSQHGSFYRCSKQATELFIENYHSVYGLNYSILRYGSLYGKRANQFNSISNMIKQALTEGKIVRGGDGEEIRDYINVLDAARASAALIDSESETEYVMLTGTQKMRIKDILNMIGEMFDNRISIEYLGDEGYLKGHYHTTPYTFRPKVARKFILNYYHDLGQGILECVYDIYEEMKKEGEEPFLKL